jgi:hypothetical protein
MPLPVLRVICAAVFVAIMSAYAHGLHWVDAQAGHVATFVVGAATIGVLLLILKLLGVPLT